MKRRDQRSSSFPALLVGVGGLLVLVLAFAGARSYRDLLAVKNREAEIRQGIAAAEQRIGELRQQIEDLETDPVTLERLAREDLGLVKPDDVVILLPQVPATPAPESTHD